MAKKERMTDGGINTIRNSALTYLSAAERQKYELARELGLLEQVKDVGWAGLSAKETGRIGGLIGQKSRKKPTETP